MARQNAQTLRIIGGQWRGRKIQFPAAEHLRPTPDRVRETLFNWLMPVMTGATCLDLFCGSGALGLEALSRGATHVTFVDANRQVIDSLRTTCQMLKTEAVDFYCGRAQDFLAISQQPVDIVFIDPPYDLLLQASVAQQLEQYDLLKTNAWIYIEHDGRFDANELPQNWRQHREKKAGQVYYSLYRNHNTE